MATQEFTQKAPTAQELRKADAIFIETAALASCIANLANLIIENAPFSLPDPQEIVSSHQLALAIENLANKIGWLSDRGGALISDATGLNGDAESWLMPPNFFAGDTITRKETV